MDFRRGAHPAHRVTVFLGAGEAAFLARPGRARFVQRRRTLVPGWRRRRRRRLDVRQVERVIRRQLERSDGAVSSELERIPHRAVGDHFVLLTTLLARLLQTYL